MTVHGEWMVRKTERVESNNRNVHGKWYLRVDLDKCWRSVIVHGKEMELWYQITKEVGARCCNSGRQLTRRG